MAVCWGGAPHSHVEGTCPQSHLPEVQGHCQLGFVELLEPWVTVVQELRVRGYVGSKALGDLSGPLVSYDGLKCVADNKHYLPVFPPVCMGQSMVYVISWISHLKVLDCVATRDHHSCTGTYLSFCPNGPSATPVVCLCTPEPMHNYVYSRLLCRSKTYCEFVVSFETVLPSTVTTGILAFQPNIREKGE